MSKPYTKKDLELFEKLGREWEAILGLQDWDIDYRLAKKRERSDYRAKVVMNRNAMNATMLLCESDTPPSPLPKKVCLELDVIHELLHLTLRPLTLLAETRCNVDVEDMDYEEHRIIQRLVKLLMGARCES